MDHDEQVAKHLERISNVLAELEPVLETYRPAQSAMSRWLPAIVGSVAGALVGVFSGAYSNSSANEQRMTLVEADTGHCLKRIEEVDGNAKHEITDLWTEVNRLRDQPQAPSSHR